MKDAYAIVTGAAKGLGNAFAVELSKRKFNTILVDLPGTGLIKFCKDLKDNYGTDSIWFETDLTLKKNITDLAGEVNKKYDVFMLINNAGAGGAGRFDKVDANYISGMIELNVMAPSVFTHEMIPNLKKQDKSYILNVSSMAAFSPMGYKTVYPASKVFINYFSRSLRQEFRKTNISVSVVCPGPMKTNANVTRRIEGQHAAARFCVVSPEKVAQRAISRLFKKHPVIIISFANALNWLLMKTVPGFIRLPLVSKTMKREADMSN